MTRPWPKVSAVCNPNGDWSVVEEGGKVIADLSKGSGQHARLVSVIRELVRVYDLEMTVESAHEFNRAMENARAVLASDSGCGATDTSAEVQERNAKRIAAALNLVAVLLAMNQPWLRKQLGHVTEIADALADAEDAG